MSGLPRPPSEPSLVRRDSGNLVSSAPSSPSGAPRAGRPPLLRMSSSPSSPAAPQPPSPATAAAASAANALLGSMSGFSLDADADADAAAATAGGTLSGAPSPPDLDEDAVHIPLPDEHTRRTMEGEAMIFKPKIRQPKRRSATEGEGEKGSAADGRSVSTAGGAATATGSAAGMMHRRHPSLPNLADSRRLRFDLLHRLGIDNSNTSELVGFRSRLPPGAVGGSSRTGRTSLLGDVASHEVPLKFGEYHIDEDSGPSAWKRFFGLGRAEDEEGDEEGRGGEDEDEDEQDEESKHLQMEVGGEKEEDGGARDGAATSEGGGEHSAPTSDVDEGTTTAKMASLEGASAPTISSADPATATAADSGANSGSGQWNGKKRKRCITFRDHVRVTPIPMRSEYSHRIRDRLWSNRLELHENAQRNAVEFSSEGWDWRTVTEDEGMYRCSVTGDLIHPVHCQHNYGAEYY